MLSNSKQSGEIGAGSFYAKTHPLQRQLDAALLATDPLGIVASRRDLRRGGAAWRFVVVAHAHVQSLAHSSIYAHIYTHTRTPRRNHLWISRSRRDAPRRRSARLSRRRRPGRCSRMRRPGQRARARAHATSAKIGRHARGCQTHAMSIRTGPSHAKSKVKPTGLPKLVRSTRNCESWEASRGDPSRENSAKITAKKNCCARRDNFPLYRQLMYTLRRWRRGAVGRAATPRQLDGALSSSRLLSPSFRSTMQKHCISFLTNDEMKVRADCCALWKPYLIVGELSRRYFYIFIYKIWKNKFYWYI